MYPTIRFQFADEKILDTVRNIMGNKLANEQNINYQMESQPLLIKGTAKMKKISYTSSKGNVAIMCETDYFLLHIS